MIEDFWNDKNTIKLPEYEGAYFQDCLDLLWFPCVANGIYFNDEDGEPIDVNIYCEPEDKERVESIIEDCTSFVCGKIPAKICKLLKDCFNHKGYFFHIVKNDKDYVGFRKCEWTSYSDIIEDLMNYFVEDVEE